ncbi:MAG: DUF1444 family protein [Pirellulales bacterium]
MGWFDFLWAPPSEDKFARQLMDALRRVGVDRKLTYDAPNRRIIIGESTDNHQAFVGNFYAEHIQLPRLERAAHLIRTAQVILSASEQMAEDWEEAQPHIRPKIWARAAMAKMRLQVRLDGGDPAKLDLPDYEVGTHFVASLVYDFPNHMASISSEQLRKWGVSHYEAIEAARENLAAEPIAIAEVGASLYAVATGDSYDACRLLLPELLERFEVEGDLIVMLPNRDSLFAAGSDNDDALARMLDLVDEALQQPRPLVPIPIRWRDGQWEDWQPSRGHPLWPRFQELRLRFLSEEYAEQRALLEQIHAKEYVDVFVASYAVLQRNDGQILSYCVWPSGVASTIPETEWVAFAKQPDDPPIMARRDEVDRIVGHLLRPTGEYPPRFEVLGFPDDDALERLRRELP